MKTSPYRLASLSFAAGYKAGGEDMREVCAKLVMKMYQHAAEFNVSHLDALHEIAAAIRNLKPSD